MRKFVGAVREAISDFIAQDCLMMAAALAYYAIFSLAPLVFLVGKVAGLVTRSGRVEARIVEEVRRAIGPGAAEQVHEMLMLAVERTESSSLLIVSIVALLIASTGIFVHLQTALNRVWSVRAGPGAGLVRNFVVKRLPSFLLILVLGLMLTISVAVTATITAFGKLMGPLVPDALVVTINSGVSFALLAGTLVLVFKWLPDARIAWRDVLLGAALTALLLVIGKLLIGWYLGQSGAQDTFGTASSLAAMLIWTYYAFIILLFGSEFTCAWAEASGREIEPEEGAMRVVVELEPPEPA